MIVHNKQNRACCKNGYFLVEKLLTNETFSQGCAGDLRLAECEQFT